MSFNIGAIGSRINDAFFGPAVEQLAESIIADPGTNENPISLDPNFHLQNGADGKSPEPPEGAPPFKRLLVLHKRLRPHPERPPGETRDIYEHAITYEQEQQMIKEGKVKCVGDCARVYSSHGAQPASRYHWISTGVHHLVDGIAELCVDLFKSLYYVGIIAGAGFYSALLFGSTPASLLLQGPVAGIVVGALFGTAVVSTVAQLVFASGIGLMKVKLTKKDAVSSETHQQGFKPWAKVAIAVATFAVSAFLAYKAIFYFGQPFVNWVASSIGSGSTAAPLNFIDAIPAISDVMSMGFTEEMIRMTFQVGFFAMGTFASSIYTWYQKAKPTFFTMQAEVRAR